MTRPEMAAAAEELSREAKVLGDLHGYFTNHAERLCKTAEIFNLWAASDLGSVLEIGPFYGYLPFFLRGRASSYTVLEGDDPAVYRLKPLYARRDIDLHLVDLFDDFGPIRGAPHSLDFPDASFDTILCWETMEHFNFNPVKFVRDLKRLLKPGGQAFITVPNRASVQNLVALFTGREDRRIIESYFTFEDYESNGKKCFYGFHWREYSVTELNTLFSSAGFAVEKSGTLFVNQNSGKIGVARSLVRVALRLASPVISRFGTTVYLAAQKPVQ